MLYSYHNHFSFYNSERYNMKTPTSSRPHWQDRHRSISNGRMAWYGDQGNERYWYEYWKARLTPDYYTSVIANDLISDQLGSVLLQEMSPLGLHLEAGCGAGYWVAALRYRGFIIEGIEYSSELVALVNAANPELPVRQGNALSIESPDNHYDTYLSIGVVEHRIEGPELFLCEAYRVLKPGGKIFISVPYFGPLRVLKDRLSMYDRRPPDLPFFQYGFTSKEFTNYLQKAGFAIQKVQALYPHRLLLEEISFFRWIVNQPWGHFIKLWAETLLLDRDGHMLLVVGSKKASLR